MVFEESQPAGNPGQLFQSREVAWRDLASGFTWQAPSGKVPADRNGCGLDKEPLVASDPKGQFLGIPFSVSTPGEVSTHLSRGFPNAGFQLGVSKG